MLDFTKYLMRYGEHGVQAILENIERNEKLPRFSTDTLETRWNRVMNACALDTARMAA